MKTAIDLIRDERLEQIEKHGYDATHDDKDGSLALVQAACTYALTGCGKNIDELFPWDKEYFKPHYDVRDLIKAGALIAAAIDVELRKMTVNERN